MCSISQGPPSLNFDILDTVVAWSDRNTLLALMLSCRYLNNGASKHLLQHPDLEDYVQIDGKGDQGVMSFVSFMHAAGSDRYCHLRAVTLGGDHISHTVAEKLAEVLRRAKNLKFLRLLDANPTLDLHPDIVPSLDSLRSIEVLKMRFTGKHTHRLLENANWPLLSVELHGVCPPSLSSPALAGLIMAALSVYNLACICISSSRQARNTRIPLS